MGKIKELSTILTNQIAAGEVIERPASVVKELIENAIDAHSTRIEIRIEEAGLKSIQISDNGDGMTREDAKMAIKRHTTSKLYTQEDLFRIRTLGFRGEALASITAVSKVTLETSTGEDVGTELIIEAGNIVEERDIAPLKGTTITVRDLFYNTPARLKFVRTLQTELSHITDIISRTSLSHPEIAFVLYNEGQELLRTSGTNDIRQAIAGNIGTTSARKMVPFQAENLDFSVSGYTSLPELTRSNRNYLFLFINGRAIRNIAIHKAIVAGYGSTLMVGRFPITVINIQMDYLLVDVNVHPTKQEVRVSKETELAKLITEAIREAIHKTQRIPAISAQDSFKRPAEQQQYAKSEQQSLHLTTDYQSQKQVDTNEYVFEDSSPQLVTDANSKRPDESDVDTVNQTFTSKSEMDSKGDTQSQKESQRSISHTTQPVEIQPSEEQTQSKEEINQMEEVLNSHQAHDVNNVLELANRRIRNNEKEAEQSFPVLYYFGQMHGTYLFAQNEQGLYMIDQHAAQERIKYEQYKVEIGQVEDQLQQLLVPIVFDFTRQEAIRIREKQDQLEQLGIFLEPFGQNSYQLQEHPAWIKEGEEQATVEEIIDFILRDEQITVATLREATAIMMSCKRSIKANHYLSDEQARQLLEDLAKCRNPYNCPHGRPVLVHFSNKEIERFFKRIQDSHTTKNQHVYEE